MENKSIKKPEIVVFAGPNGSGKSTITNLLRPPMLPYINADEIQRVLDCDNMEAAKIAENIVALTGISNAQRAPLNNHRTQS